MWITEIKFKDKIVFLIAYIVTCDMWENIQSSMSKDGESFSCLKPFVLLITAL